MEVTPTHPIEEYENVIINLIEKYRPKIDKAIILEKHPEQWKLLKDEIEKIGVVKLDFFKLKDLFGKERDLILPALAEEGYVIEYNSDESWIGIDYAVYKEFSE